VSLLRLKAECIDCACTMEKNSILKPSVLKKALLYLKARVFEYSHTKGRSSFCQNFEKSPCIKTLFDPSPNLLGKILLCIDCRGILGNSLGSFFASIRGFHDLKSL